MLFWIICAVLTAGVIFALARPLARPASTGLGRAPDLDVYRDQLKEIEAVRARGLLNDPDAEAAQAEVARRLLAGAAAVEARAASAGPRLADGSLKPIVMGIAAVVPIVALTLYLILGSPGLPGQPASERLVRAPSASSPVAALVAQVEARLREHPNDGRGWEVIAPVYLRQQRYQEAADAFVRAIDLLGETASRLAGFAEATVYANNGIVIEPARKAFEKIATLDPTRPEPRFWLALAKEQDGELESAAADYRALLAQAPADAQWRIVVEEQLHAILARLGQTESQATGGPGAADIAAAAGLPEAQRMEMIGQMVEGLAQRLKTNGKDLAGWRRLLRSYAVLGQMEKAEQALADARKALNGDGQALSDLNAFAKSLGLKS